MSPDLAAALFALLGIFGLHCLALRPTADSRRPSNPEAGDDYDCCVWLSRYGEDT